MSQKIEIAIRFRHPTMNLQRFSNLIGIPPSIIWKNGDRKTTPKGNEIDGYRTSSFCSIKVPLDSCDSLQSAIVAAISLMVNHRIAIRRMQARGGSTSLFVGWFFEFDGGDTLDQETISKMADLRVALELNVYDTRADVGCD